MNKTLAALALAFGLGCSSGPRSVSQQDTQKGPRKLTHHESVQLEDKHKDMRKDYKITRSEIDYVIATHQWLSNAELADGEGEHVKDDLVAVKKMYRDFVEEIFDNLDLYVVFTGVDTKEFQNVPANLGAVRPLYALKGKDARDKLPDDFKLREKYVLSALYEWKQHGVSKGSIQEGGGRIQGLDRLMVIDKDTAGKFVGDGLVARSDDEASLSKDLWAACTDGKWENGEFRSYFAKPILRECELAKPAEKQ